jgi:DNA uptake protein ComE-like DNA-binding protein
MVSLRAEPPPVVEAEPEVEWAEPEAEWAEPEAEWAEPEAAVAEVVVKPEPEVEDEPEPPPTSRFASSDEDGQISLQSATFEDLRGLGMSVTQARRVLHYRDERGLDSVAGLEQVPGLPRDFRAELAQRLSD